jgi:hypothetical protein
MSQSRNGLARSVRAEQGEDRSGLDPQVDVIDGDEVTEAFGQLVGDYGQFKCGQSGCSFSYHNRTDTPPTPSSARGGAVRYSARG